MMGLLYLLLWAAILFGIAFAVVWVIVLIGTLMIELKKWVTGESDE